MNGGCDFGKATREMLSTHRSDYSKEKENMQKQINMLLNNRLPVWATVVIALLSGAVSWFGKG